MIIARLPTAQMFAPLAAPVNGASRSGVYRPADGAGGGGGIRTHGDLSATPVFKFDGIQSASVRTEQPRTSASPPVCIMSVNVHPLGGQGGGHVSTLFASTAVVQRRGCQRGCQAVVHSGGIREGCNEMIMAPTDPEITHKPDGRRVRCRVPLEGPIPGRGPLPSRERETTVV
jgi:hypothetical protein